MRSFALFAVTCAAAFAATNPLADAIRSGQKNAANDLIAKKSPAIHSAEADGSTPLLWAANKNDLDLVQKLLQAGANPNVKNSLGSAPLLEAVFNANTAMVKALLDAGADANIAGADGQTPLMLIARTGDVEAAKLLLAKGANPNTKEAQRGQTALMWAAAASEAAMVRALLDGGADPNAQSTLDLMTPLVSAEPRAQPRPPGGITPMIFASREGCIECVKALLDKGAKIDLADPEGVTPLLTALWNTRFDVAKILIERGADINKWDWWGRSPLYLAVDYNTLPKGGRPDQPSLDAATPLDIVKLLLDKGANPNLQLKMFPPYRATGNDRGMDGMITVGTTPLIRAAKAQDWESVELLLAHGAKVDLPNSLGITPLQAAAGVGSSARDARQSFRLADVQERAIKCIDLMLKAGGELNTLGGRQPQGPIHGAAFFGWDKVVAFLLEKGANINMPDSRGLTALDYAEDRGGSAGNTLDVSAGRLAAAALLKAKGGQPGTPVPAAGPGRRPGA